MYYSVSELSQKLRYYKSLPEKARRHFLALEYASLGKGSQRYIAQVFSCSRSTIIKGKAELASVGDGPLDYSRQRKAGGGRKKKECSVIDLPERILSIVAPHTAASPTDPSVKWTHLKPSDISKEYSEQYNDRVSNGTIKRILAKLGYVKRRPSKNLAIGKSPFRQQQFRIIFYFAFLFAEMEENPILSMDTKKKEKLGDFKRNGSVYCQKAPGTYTQDYNYLAKGKVVPHGLYDMKLNEGYVSIGTNYETADFLIDNLIWWWENYGIHLYPDATHLLLFCDAGGANSYRHHAFKKQLVRLAAYIGLKIVVVHYPPYCSKWNPIEHRLFSQMHLQADGAIFLEYEQVKQIFERTTTKTGLKVFVRINKTIYQKGRKTCKTEVDYNKILTHSELPQFNYMVIP